MKKFYSIAMALVLGAFAANAQTPTITPVNGTTLPEMPEYITLTWEGATLALNPDSEVYDDPFGSGPEWAGVALKVLVNGEEWIQREYDVEKAAQAVGSIEGSSLVLSLGGIQSNFAQEFQSGKISMTLPAGGIFVDGEPCEVVNLSYDIVSPYMAAPVADPDIDVLFLCWDETIYSAANEDDNYVMVTMYTPAPYYETLQVPAYITNWTPGAVEGDNVPNDNALMIPVYQYVDQWGYGNYDIQVAAGTVKNAEGKGNPYVWESIYVEAPAVDVPQPTVIVTANGLTINWGTLTVEGYAFESELIIYNPKDGEEEYRIPASEVSLVGQYVIVDLTSLKLTNKTEYRLEVPEGTFFLSDQWAESSAVEYTFTYDQTSGVNGLGVDVENAEIYNLQGVKVGNNVNGLSNGLYIINGKKVLIRK